uniref:Tribbles pseudokinase 2 n=1 Tax=Saimiri boliviensis boliviensis TaxID=39432 RepID=A0A2K6T671_SAIBB
MNIHRSTPITIARYGRSRNKTQDFEELSSIRSAEPSQSFSPNLGSPSPPETPNLSHCVSCIGKYLLLEPLEGDHVFRAVHLHSGEELVCKVFDISCYQESLAPCFCLSAHSNINQITEILLGETKAYVFFERSYGDMHSFVRTCKKLREEEAARLFYQIASAVAHFPIPIQTWTPLPVEPGDAYPGLPLVPCVILVWSFISLHPPSTSLIFLILLFPPVCYIGSKVFSVYN